MENTPQSTFTTILEQYHSLSRKEFAKWFHENWLDLNDQENQYMEHFYTEGEALLGMHETFQDGRLEEDVQETESVSAVLGIIKVAQKIRIYGEE